MTQSRQNQLGDFLLLKKLGEGGMGTVFKARQLAMERDVALKVLPKHLAKDEKFVERFYREARASARLDHPNIVSGIAIGQERGFHYFAMEFIDGQTCAAIRERVGRFAVPDAVRIGLDVARALEHAHSRGIIHRDIKPENIMVTQTGVVKLTDLGLAKQIDQDSGLTQTSSGFGTPYFMAPEQARNAKSADQRCDIYALGATLYYLLTGQLPYEGETPLEVLTAKEEGRHRPARLLNPEVPELLDLILDKMMAVEPGRRYQSAAEVVSALERAGLAADSLSCFGHRDRPAAPAPPTAPTALQVPPVPTQPRRPAPPPGKYYLRYKDRRGTLRKVQGDKHQIRDLIRRGLLGTGVQGARDPKGPFRPLLAFPEFADLMKARVIKERGDQATGGGLASRFEQLDWQERRRRRMRALKRRLAQALRLLLLLAVLGAGSYFAWRYLQHRADQSSSRSGQPAATTP